MSDCGAFVEDLNRGVGGFEFLDDGGWVIAGCFDDFDVRVEDYLGVGVVVWWVERGEEG